MIALVASLALAQDQGIDAHRFPLAAYDGDVLDSVTIQRVDRFEPMGFYAGGLFEYADSPLVRVTTHRDGSITRTGVVDDLVALNLSAGLAVHERVRLDLLAPVYFASRGLDGPQGAGIGDLRLGTLIALVQPDRYSPEGEATGFALGVAPYVDLPTGAEANFLGQTKVGGGAKLAATLGLSRVVVASDVGFEANPAVDLGNISGADELVGGIGASFLVAPGWGLGTEARLAAPLASSAEPGTGAASEGIVSVRHRTSSGAHMLLGASSGLTGGVGTARYRVFLGGGFGGSSAYGVADVPGQLTVTVLRDGSPVEGAEVTLTGGDEVLEKVSREDGVSIETPTGVSWRGEARLGPCLAGEATATSAARSQMTIVLENRRDGRVEFEVVDQDGAPVPEAQITWRNDPEGCVPTELLVLERDGTGEQPIGLGEHRVDVGAPGYTSASAPVQVDSVAAAVQVRIVLEKEAQVRVEREQIVITDRVYFPNDSAVIEQRSYALLDEVAATLAQHAEILKVQIDGHTDDTGTPEYNLDLSQRRAEAVRDYLIGRGVDPKRLQAQGYGMTRPIDSNTSEEGRANNRRVEFLILERSD